ncbi:MICOS complex subunit Mic10 [Lamellibrachia satsuma]|nr:MICOS complex subunit Mic10 [Lamellibrachia satsuma]
MVTIMLYTKKSSGIGLGIVFSVIFFRRRPWPVAFGSGVGIGMGYANCQHDFASPQLMFGQLKRIEKKVSQ